MSQSMGMISVSTGRDSAWIELDHPARANALGTEMVEALLAAVREAIDARMRVLVLSGVGNTFCGGFDLSSLEHETDATLAWRFLRIETLLQTLYYAPLYTVALAHGSVSGAGADLVAACARRVAAPGARFRFPGVRFGIVLGSRRLSDLVGSRGRTLILEQETVAADEAFRIGLVNGIAEPAGWASVVDGVRDRAIQVPAEAAARVMALDSAAGERDMGNLALSVAEPGLKERISAYWRSVKAAAKK